MVQTQIELKEEQLKALEALADQRHLTVSDLVQQSIDYLLLSEPGHYTTEQRRKGLAAVGRFKSGLGDLSQKHDEYLTELPSE